MSKLEYTQHAGTYELLSTKLTSPRLRSSLVSREPLLARLDEGLEHKLTLLSAPAGFGKTTLVSEWIATRSERRDSPPVAWVSLDAGDNDPVRFWRYVITACQVFDPAVGESTLALLHMSRRPSLESVLATFINELATFINELAQLVYRGVLVLEDYHVITAPQIHESVAFLLDHLPATLHLLMLTRSDPPLPLARLRAHGDLSELHAADLRFSLQETRAFLRQALPFPLPVEAITRLEARTEGWVAGLRLLALALQGRKDPQDLEHVLATFTGSHRHILEYLVADVLSSQPEPLQEFLLQTSVLSRLTGSLCDTVTGRNDSERVLEQLERANLFLIPLEGVGRWYRYHALFAEAMQHEARRRLGDDALRACQSRASSWYEHHGMLTEAAEAALEAQAFAQAAVLMEQIIRPHYVQELHEYHTLRRWLDVFPEAILGQYPRLCFRFAMLLLCSSDLKAPASPAPIERLLHLAERAFGAEDNRSGLGEVHASRALLARLQGDLAVAARLARQALAWLPAGEQQW